MDITIPNSVYIDGQWATATWLAEIADPATGELIITATINQPTRVAALRLTNDMMRDLRTMAGITGPTPTQRADRAAAQLAYWRESVQFAADMLFRGRSQTINWPNDAINVEAYLRQLLTLDDDTPAPSDPPDTPCYDCRTTGERLAEIDRRIDALVHESAQMFSAIERRLDALEQLQKRYDRLMDSAASAHSLVILSERVAAIESSLAGNGDDNIGQFGRLVEIERRLDALVDELHAPAMPGPDAGL